MNRRLILALPLLLGAGCGIDVGYNFDSDANFSEYKTYRWVELKGAQKPDQITDGQLRQVVDEELAKKGLRKVDTEDADLYVGYQISIDSEKQFTSYDTGWGYGPGWRWGGYGMGSTMRTGQTSTINIGTAVVDMYDRKAKKLVWRGQATKTLDPKKAPEKRMADYRAGAAKLFANYPPDVKK